MFNVVELVCPEVGFTEDLDATVKVGPMIVEDGTWCAGPLHGILQASGYRLLGRVGHRHQSNRLHVLMTERPALGKIAQPDA